MIPRAARLALLVVCLPLGCRHPAEPPKGPDPREKDKPSLVFRGFAARASHDGVVLWEAQADRARVNHDGDRAHGEVVTFTYFNHGKAVSHGRADRADINLKSYDIQADGSVEVVSSNNVILRTPHLFWDNRRQRISSSSNVEVVRGHTVLTGRGFTGDRDLNDVRILADVQAEAVSVEDLRKESKTWQRP